VEQFISIVISFFLGLFGVGEVAYDGVLPIATTTAEVVQVVDGDTIRVRIDGKIESVRYTGIDTPEPYRYDEPACFSQEASQRNRELVAGKIVELVSDELDRDTYDRLLRYVYLDGEFINEVLVQEGYADTLAIPPNTSKAAILQAAKDEAIEGNRGLWAVCR
jgi:micrococcal nuclease